MKNIDIHSNLGYNINSKLWESAVGDLSPSSGKEEKRLRFLNKILNRIVFVVLALLIQLSWFFLATFYLSESFAFVNIFLNLISLLVVLYIINRNSNPTVKLAWVVPILTIPLFGGIIYLMFGGKSPTRKMRRKLEKSSEQLKPYAPDHSALTEEIFKSDPGAGGQVRYLNHGGFSVYRNTECRYFELGDSLFPVLLEELEKAKKFIFIEFFIVEEGKMWNTILDILKRKAAEGVDVRILYDDVGSLTRLPYGYDRELEQSGVHCMAFNSFKPVLSIVMNNRDHRKILVIDGNVGFTGGINIADEYINEKQRFGHWKDTAVMLHGEAVWNLTMLFLEMWNAFRPTDEQFEQFMPKFDADELPESDGYVLPYGDSPLDDEILAENVYLNIINHAKRYLYIFTPYLIIDNETVTALRLAAMRGVDVRIITPGIPDKKTIFHLTRSHYAVLIESGIKIFEYTPGFMHAKSFVCDDEIAVVGTINLDYRSLYLHFECGAFFYKSSIIKAVRDDFLKTQELSSPAKIMQKPVSLTRGIYYAILRLFSPLF